MSLMKRVSITFFIVLLFITTKSEITVLSSPSTSYPESYRNPRFWDESVGYCYVGQKTGNSCGPASVQMVLEYFDISPLPNQSQLAKEMNTDMLSYTYPDYLYIPFLKRSFFNYYNVSLSSNFERALDNLKGNVSRNFPVIILTWSDSSHKTGHYRVVTGYNSSGVFNHDPWNGPNIFLSNSTLQNLWSYSHFWAFIIEEQPRFDLVVTAVDQSSSERPMAGAFMTISGLQGWIGGNGNDTMSFMTSSTGSIILLHVPEGVKHITVMCQSQFNPELVTIWENDIVLDKTLHMTIRTEVFDAELQLVSPSGKLIAGAEMSLAGVSLGMTGSDGKVVAPQVPGKYTEASAAYPVSANWFGVDISPAPVTITISKTYILTASNVATLTVQVVGAQGQGLNAAKVDIKNTVGTTVFSGFADEQGVANVEVPYGTYSVSVDYKGFTNTASSSVDSPSGTVQTIATNVFIEIFGQAMTFATFVFWIIVIVIILLMVIAVIVMRHRKPPEQTLPPPPPPTYG